MLGKPSGSPFLRAMLLASALGACLSTPAMAQDSTAPIRCDGRLAGAPPSQTHRSLTVRPLTEDAVRVCVAAPKQRRRDPDSVTYRQEGTISGVAFAFDEVTGVGLVHGEGFAWWLECTVDPMTDAPSCLLSDGGPTGVRYFRVFLGRGGCLVSFGGRKYPGSELEVRVDSLSARRAPERPGFVSTHARELLAEMSSGRQALLRLTEWPSNQYDSRVLNLQGFGAAHELFTRAFHRIEHELQAAAKKPGF